MWSFPAPVVWYKHFTYMWSSLTAWVGSRRGSGLAAQTKTSRKTSQPLTPAREQSFNGKVLVPCRRCTWQKWAQHSRSMRALSRATPGFRSSADLLWVSIAAACRTQPSLQSVSLVHQPPLPLANLDSTSPSEPLRRR